MAGQTKDQREITQLKIESLRLDNQMKKAEIDSVVGRANSQVGPSMQDPNIELKTAKVVAHAPSNQGQEAGSITDVSFTRDNQGNLYPVPSRDAKERIEDQIVPEMQWTVRNVLGPIFSGEGKPSKSYLPKGKKDWEFNFFKGRWEAVGHKGKSPWEKWSDWLTRWRHIKAPYRYPVGS